MNVTSVPSKGPSPPQVVRGALYEGSAEDYNFYLYGGTTSYLNTTFQGWQNTTPATNSLWAYDDTLRQEWDQFNVRPSSPNRSSSGASAEAPDQGLAFYFNGKIDNGSSSAIANLRSSVQTVLDGMIVINTEDHNARNLSTSIVVGNRPRIRGQMQYVPSIGEKGVLVLLGGSCQPVTQLNNSETPNLVPMDVIDVFDVASLYSTSLPDGVWYR